MASKDSKLNIDELPVPGAERQAAALPSALDSLPPPPPPVEDDTGVPGYQKLMAALATRGHSLGGHGLEQSAAYLQKGLQKVLGGVGGVARTGVASALGQTQPGDWKRAAKLEAPTTSEYLARAGMDPGPELSDVLPIGKNKFYNASARGALGLAGDALTDPLIWDSLLTHGADSIRGKAPEAAAMVDQAKDFKPMQAASPDLGVKLYRNALSDVDRAYSKRRAFVDDLTQTPFSDLAYEKEFLPSFAKPTKLEQATRDYRNGPEIGGKYNAILDSEGSQNLRLNPTDAARRSANWMRDKFQLARNRPDLLELLQSAQSENDANPGGLSGRLATDLKSGWTNEATGKVGAQGDILARFARTPVFKQGMARMAKQLGEMRNEGLAQAGVPGAEELPDLDRQYSTLGTAEKPLNQLRAKAQGKKWWTQFDAPLAAIAGGAAYSGHPEGAALAAAMLGAKNLTRFINSPGGGVTTGNAVRAFGKMSPWDKLLKQGMLTPKSSEDDK